MKNYLERSLFFLREISSKLIYSIGFISKGHFFKELNTLYPPCTDPADCHIIWSTLHLKFNECVNEQEVLLHYVRPSFTVSPTQSEEFFLVQPLLTKSTRVLTSFPGWRLQWMTVLSLLIRAITAGDWHILLSCYVTLLWLRVRFNKFPFCECEDSPRWWLNS